MPQDFRKLIVWRKAHRLTLLVYEATRAYPDDERFGMTAQSRRSAASIPTNVAEGAGRATRKEYARYLGYSLASTNELDYQLLLARDLGVLDPTVHERLLALLVEVRRMLAAMIRKLRRPPQ